MVNMNEMISNNIMNIMKQNDKKQIDLAGYLGVSKQVISKMLNGARMINAIELQKIAEFLGVSMESLVKIPQVIPETNTVKAFMGRVESQEANAFAALLLAPKDRLEEQSDVYNLSYKDVSVQVILKIMDIFAVPYKAAVLRLFEEEKINIKTARKLLQIGSDEISKQIEVTGKAARWQEIPRNLIQFGSLSEKMYDLEQWEGVRDERLKSDKARLNEIVKMLGKSAR